MCERERNDKGLLGLLANEREEVARAWFIIIFSFLNRTGSIRFGSIRVGRFRHTKTRNRTGPDIFINILTGSIGFFTDLVILVFSVKLIFQFFCSPLLKTLKVSTSSKFDG